MEKVGLNYKLPEKKRGPNCSRNAIIQQLTDLLGDPFQKTMGRVRQMTEAEITDIYLTALRWKKNPPALAQILIKKKLWEIKEKKKLSTGISK